MNIFILDTDKKLAAEYHCDKHVVKMIVEYAQLLSTAHHHYSTDGTKLYKPTHKKHPCTLWVIESKSNYVWLYELFLELCEQYKIRYGKEHATFLLLSRSLKNPPLKQPDIGLTDFALAMPDIYKDKNPVVSYRKYYLGEKSRFAIWRAPIVTPLWFRERNPYLGVENE